MRTRHRLIALALALALTVSATAPAGLASASRRGSRLEAELDRACTATLVLVRKAVTDAATVQTQTIVSQVDVSKPGRLTASIAFNPTGDRIKLAGEAFSLGCAGPNESHPRGPGRSHTVATLDETLARPGRYTLTFQMNSTGQRILARLGARQRAYRKRHPHGRRPPTIAFGVGLTYATAG